MTFHISDLCYRYKKKSRPALDGMTLELPSDGVTAILGMSGSGKTTLLNILGLLASHRRLSGTIVWQHDELPKKQFCYNSRSFGWWRQAIRLKRSFFGVVLQSSYLLPNFSCEYNVMLPLLLQKRDRSQCTKAFQCLMASLDQRHDDLRDCMKKRPAHVSGGQRQRLAVLRAIVHDPAVVLADEPFAHLDPHNTKMVIHLLEHWRVGGFATDSTRKNRQRGLVLVTHEIREAVRVAKRVALVREGKIAGDGLSEVSSLPGWPSDLDETVNHICSRIEPNGEHP